MQVLLVHTILQPIRDLVRILDIFQSVRMSPTASRHPSQRVMGKEDVKY